MKLDMRTETNLKGVHPDLVKVVRRAAQITELAFTCIEGVRTKQKQEKLVLAGASWTMNSRHLTGHAVDLAALVGGQIRWDWGLYLKIAEAMAKASAELGIPIRWGGTWKLLDAKQPITTAILHKTKPDGPHFELPIANYP